ncbi:hypothetical protein MCM1_0969 [Methanosarcina barkeri CM1]|uniref:Uncharacterized protein n=1 Tax=Methanosarcina barkeri CM1 TaxID=796385 RepID=A0A0G3CG13_METBA|nr:hypothetical protein MCM1_0969 [Methanosarcina barkeri CM1]
MPCCMSLLLNVLCISFISFYIEYFYREITFILETIRKVNNDCCKNKLGRNKFGWISHLIVCEKKGKMTVYMIIEIKS